MDKTRQTLSQNGYMYTRMFRFGPVRERQGDYFGGGGESSPGTEARFGADTGCSQRSPS